MKNLSLYVIVETIFKFILLFLLNLIWCLYFINTPWVAIVTSIILSLLITLITNIFSKKKMVKKDSILKKEQHIENVKNTLIYMASNEIVNFFYRLCATRHSCKIENNYILIETTSLPIIFVPMYKLGNLTSDEILQFYKKIKHKNLKRLIFVTNSLESNLLATSNNFKFETLILDHKQTYYSLLEKYEFFPEIQIKQKQKTKNTFKQIFSIALNKKKTKGYLMSSLFIFFASFFVSYKIYYLIFSSLLIILAFFSHFNPTFNIDTKVNPLE